MGGGGGGVRGQCVLLKPNIFIPIPTGKVFIAIIRRTKQKFVTANRTKWTIKRSFSRYLSGRHYLLYSAPRKRLPGFLQTLHSVKEMNFVKKISKQVHVLYNGTGNVGRMGLIDSWSFFFCLCALLQVKFNFRLKVFYVPLKFHWKTWLKFKKKLKSTCPVGK